MMNIRRSTMPKKWINLFAACALLSLSSTTFAQSSESVNLAAESEMTVIASARSPGPIVTKSPSKEATSAVSVQTTPVVLTLEDIQVMKTSDHLSGDEIYVNVTEYSSVDKPSMHRVPEYPSHWLSKYIEKVKNIPIWNKAIQEGESVQLIISVVEAEAPPWDVDDLIGSVKLKVYIEKGKLEQEWSIPNSAITKQAGEKGHFVLTGDGAEYKISLKLKLDKK